MGLSPRLGSADDRPLQVVDAVYRRHAPEAAVGLVVAVEPREQRLVTAPHHGEVSRVREHRYDDVQRLGGLAHFQAPVLAPVRLRLRPRAGSPPQVIADGSLAHSEGAAEGRSGSPPLRKYANRHDFLRMQSIRDPSATTNSTGSYEAGPQPGRAAKSDPSIARGRSRPDTGVRGRIRSPSSGRRCTHGSSHLRSDGEGAFPAFARLPLVYGEECVLYHGLPSGTHLVDL